MNVDFLFYVNAGQIISDGTVKVNPVVQIGSYTIVVNNVMGLQAGQQLVLSAPPGYGSSTIPMSGFFSQGLPMPAMLGKYTIVSGDQTWQFELVSAPSRLIVAKPSIEINDGIIKAIHVQWIFAETGIPISEQALSKILAHYEIQISGSGKPCNDYSEGPDRLYDSGLQGASITSISLSCPGLEFTHIANISIAYQGRYPGEIILTYFR